jgi:Tfp pilus assembly protein PilF
MHDADEYLHLAVHASAIGDRHAAMGYLKEVLLQQPRNATAIYLLAVQHAEIGLTPRAVTGLHDAITIEPRLEVARFQLGWLLLDANRIAEAKEQFSALSSSADEALRAYSEAMLALADKNMALARDKLTSGLSRKTNNPGLSASMRRLLEQLSAAPAPPAGPSETKSSDAVFLGAYAKGST